MDPYNSADAHNISKPQDNPYAAPAARLAEQRDAGQLEKAGRGARLGAVLVDGVPLAVVGILAAILIPIVGNDGKGGTVLRLTTYYKVSLPWNGYGRWWADRLLTDFHSVVLDVVKQRAEADAAAVPSPSAPPV